MNNSVSSILRTRNWQSILTGALIGLLIVMAVLMKWLVQSQVDAAQERRSLEALAREAETRCFALASHHATAACRAAHASAAASGIPIR